MSVNKLDWITNTNVLVNLPTQLKAAVSCGDVKFRTERAAEKPFSLHELFQYVEMRAAKDRTFVNTDLLDALQTIKNQRTKALALKAPLLSPKWIYHLLVQLGRLIARLFSGYKTINYDARLVKLSKELNAKLPSSSINHPTFINNDPSLYITLAKMENSEPVTIEEFQRISKQIITLDLTKWKTPRQVLLTSSTGPQYFEWITTLANEARNLKKVILPDMDLDPNLIYWFVVDPENENNTSPEYVSRQPKKTVFSPLQSQNGIKFLNSTFVDVEIPIPSFAKMRPLHHSELTRLRAYFQKQNKLQELLEKNLPDAANEVATKHLHTILGDSSAYIPSLAKNIRFLFDKNFTLLPLWAKWLSYCEAEDLYEKVYEEADKETMLFPLLEGLRTRIASLGNDYQTATLKHNQQKWLLKLLSRPHSSKIFTFQLVSYLLLNSSKIDLSSIFKTDKEVEQFLDYFVVTSSPNEQKILERILSLLRQSHPPALISLLITKFPTWKFCPVTYLQTMPALGQGTLISAQTSYCAKNIYFAALLTILKDQHSEIQQQQLLLIFNTFEALMINNNYSYQNLQTEVFSNLVTECSPAQLSILISALLTNYIRMPTDINKQNFVLVFETIKKSSTPEHAEKIKAFFRAYWPFTNRLPQEMHTAIALAIRYLETKADINAFLSSADEANLLQPYSSHATFPYQLAPLHFTWFEYLFAYQNGVSKEEIVAILCQYPEQCLRLPAASLQKIFPEHAKLAKQVVQRANEHFLQIYQQLDVIPPELRLMTLEYGGFDATLIASAKEYENTRRMASHPLPSTRS